MKHEPPTPYDRHIQPASPDEAPLTPLTLDPGEYHKHLDEFDLTEEQKLALLQTLWTIMQTMVDIGFGLDSTQMFLSKLSADFDTDSGNEVNINHTDNFNHASMEGGPNE